MGYKCCKTNKSFKPRFMFLISDEILSIFLGLTTSLEAKLAVRFLLGKGAIQMH